MRTIPGQRSGSKEKPKWETSLPKNKNDFRLGFRSADLIEPCRSDFLAIYLNCFVIVVSLAVKFVEFMWVTAEDQNSEWLRPK